MITSQGMPFLGLKKFPYTGSYQGMHYYMRSFDKGETISAFIYPGPWCFEKTPEEKMEKKDFPFSLEGLEELVAWLNQKYTQEEQRWRAPVRLK
ncbi:MAG: hypothetical protein PHN80_10565 [Hespellia sp.]|nr:hypothetical protein [Hespellia sp.]